MPKFHDEFFRKTTPDHDHLIALTLKNNQIIKKLVMGINFFDLNKSTTIFVCDPAVFRPSMFLHECKLKNKTAFRSARNLDGRCFNSPCDACKPIEAQFINFSYDCEYNGFETEKICKKNDFIIGYADIVMDFTLTQKKDLQIDAKWVWKDFETRNIDVKVVIECKPTLKSWGGALRQIKTYLSVLNDGMYSRTTKFLGIITTFSKIADEYKKILLSENIYIKEFEKTNGQKILS